MTHARLIICSLSSLLLASCVSGPVPKWDGKIWIGRSKQVGIIFTDSDGKNEVVRADDPRFNDYIAMTSDVFKALIVTYVQGCKQWKPGVRMMTASQANMRFQVFLEDLKNEAEQERKDPTTLENRGDLK